MCVAFTLAPGSFGVVVASGVTGLFWLFESATHQVVGTPKRKDDGLRDR